MFVSYGRGTVCGACRSYSGTVRTAWALAALCKSALLDVDERLVQRAARTGRRLAARAG